MSDKTPTAVGWLVQQLQENTHSISLSIIQQAKEIEKQQIIDAYHINPEKSKFYNCGIDYYTETFKP